MWDSQDLQGFGFLGLDSLVWIPCFRFHGFGFLCLDFKFGFKGLNSLVWIPGFSIDGFGFFVLDPWPGLSDRPDQVYLIDLAKTI